MNNKSIPLKTLCFITVASLACLLALLVGCEYTSNQDVEQATTSDESVANLDKAPEFTLPSANTGTEISLSQFRDDKPVVLVFYRAYW